MYYGEQKTYNIKNYVLPYLQFQIYNKHRDISYIKQVRQTKQTDLLFIYTQLR